MLAKRKRDGFENVTVVSADTFHKNSKTEDCYNMMLKNLQLIHPTKSDNQANRELVASIKNLYQYANERKLKISLCSYSTNEEKSIVRACCLVIYKDTMMTLANFSVESQGQGYGSKFLSLLWENFTEINKIYVTVLTNQTEPENEKRISFYRKNGFQKEPARNRQSITRMPSLFVLEPEEGNYVVMSAKRKQSENPQPSHSQYNDTCMTRAFSLMKVVHTMQGENVQ